MRSFGDLVSVLVGMLVIGRGNLRLYERCHHKLVLNQRDGREAEDKRLGPGEVCSNLKRSKNRNNQRTVILHTSNT